MARRKKYLATDGKLVLWLEQEGNWLCVTAPFEPGVNTQARTLSEAFEMAYDALKTLRAGRRRLQRSSGFIDHDRRASSRSRAHLRRGLIRT